MLVNGQRSPFCQPESFHPWSSPHSISGKPVKAVKPILYANFQGLFLTTNTIDKWKELMFKKRCLLPFKDIPLCACCVSAKKKIFWDACRFEHDATH